LGVPSPPPSPETAPIGRSRPSLQPQHRKRSGDAACHITEECERLFCETLKAVFLVEKRTACQNSLEMDTLIIDDDDDRAITATGATTASRPIPQQSPTQSALLQHGQITPSPSPDGRIYPKTTGLVRDYVEVWDYVGGVGFKGFVAEHDAGRTLFVFFGKEVIETDLKPGLMSLLELAVVDRFDCAKLVIGLDREAGDEAVKDLSHDLGWAGFELTMLDEWAGQKACTSDRWLFVEVDT